MFLKESQSIWESEWLSPKVIVAYIGILIVLFFSIRSIIKSRPKMVKPYLIIDEFGERILFTIISNNSTGTHLGKLYISKRFSSKKLLRKIFINKKRIDYQSNTDFLKNQHYDTIPKYTIKEQDSFIFMIDCVPLTVGEVYKLTFSTPNGCCSNTYQHSLDNQLLYDMISNASKE